MTLLLQTLLKSALLGVLTFAALSVGIGSAAAADATPNPPAAQGTLRNDSTPVPDVRLTLEQPPGTVVAETRTDAEGKWRIEAPAPGRYTVSLDVSTLPEGVAPRDPDNITRTLPLDFGQARTALFALGPGAVSTTTTTDRILATAVEGLRFGLVMALAAVGLSLIFGTTGLTNFAHGELITLGAITAWFLNSTGLHLIPATLITVVICGIFGGLLDLGFWGVLRRRGTGLIAMMIISIGLALFLRYFYLVVFDGSTRSYAQYAAQRSLDLGPITLAPKDFASMAIALLVLVLTGLALLKTRLGKATRAVADNPKLAAASGINVESVIRIVWIAGAAMAGLAGVLLALNQQVGWQMGMQILLLVFAAVTLGGLGTAFGALVGSLVIGMFVQMSQLVIPSELKNVGALLILILVLLIRPQGILGRAQRVG